MPSSVGDPHIRLVGSRGASCLLVSQSQSAEWPHSPAAAAPARWYRSRASSARRGFSIPSPATMPPAIIRIAADDDPEMERGSRGIGGRLPHALRLRRRQPLGIRHGQRVFLGFGDRARNGGGDRHGA